MFADVGGFPDRGPVRERTSGVPLVCVLVCPDCAMLVTWASGSIWLIRPEPDCAHKAGDRFRLLVRSPFLLVGPKPSLFVEPEPDLLVELESSSYEIVQA